MGANEAQKSDQTSLSICQLQKGREADLILLTRAFPHLRNLP